MDNFKDPIASENKIFPSYQSRVESLCWRYPHLRNLSDFLDKDVHHKLGRIACLEFRKGSVTPTHRELKLDDVADCWRPRKESDLQGQILIVEDLTKELIETLGSGLNIDPVFFARHVHLSRTDESTCSGHARLLPSVTSKKPFITIYANLNIVFEATDNPPPPNLQCSSNVQRKIGILAPAFTKGLYFGSVSRITSLIRIPLSHDTWICE